MFDHRHQVSYRIRSSMCRLSGLDHERAACGLRRLDTGIYMQPRCRMLLFQTLSLLRTAHMVGATPTCEINGYCSLEKLAPFVGDLYPSKRCSFEHWCMTCCSLTSCSICGVGGGLHRALQLRSYKHEVILMVSDIHRLDSFLQAADSLQQLGLSNILLLSYSSDRHRDLLRMSQQSIAQTSAIGSCLPCAVQVH